MNAGAYSTNANSSRTDYVAIADAVNTILPTAPTHTGSHGLVSNNGCLFPNSKIGFRDITDGSSNTMMVGEISTYYTTTAGVKYGGIQPNMRFSWLMGTNYTSGYTAGGTDARGMNWTHLRYGPNYKGATPVVGTNGIGAVLTQSTTAVDPGANHPLLSGHTGGVHILLADGSVRFISDSISLVTLGRLAARNDDQVVGEF